MAEKKFSVVELVNNDGCFDLQFRKDTRYERTNSPTYYRWKAQFIVTRPKKEIKTLEKIKKEMGCGEVCIIKDQARFSVQKIDDIANLVIPYFKKNLLEKNKKKDFELWARGAEIIHKNKGVYLSAWKKSDLLQLMQIQKSSAKYKRQTRSLKWIDMAHALSKTN